MIISARWNKSLGNPTFGTLLLAHINLRLIFPSSSSIEISFLELPDKKIVDEALSTLKKIDSLFEVRKNPFVEGRISPKESINLTKAIIDSFRFIRVHQVNGHQVLHLTEFGLHVEVILFRRLNVTKFGIINLNFDGDLKTTRTNKTKKNNYCRLCNSSTLESMFVINSNSLSGLVQGSHLGLMAQKMNFTFHLEELLVLYFKSSWIFGSANGIAVISILGNSNSILFKSFFCHTLGMLKEFGITTSLRVTSPDLGKHKIIRTNFLPLPVLKFYFRKVL